MWQIRELRFTLKTPLHIGFRPLGFISRTLSYIPAHTMFLALVPAVVKGLGLELRPEVFQQIEACLRPNLYCSPIFIRHNGDYLFPFRPASQEIIERHYLFSQYGVCLDFKPRSAREGMLFETEYICPMARGLKKPVPTQFGGFILFRPFKKGHLNLSLEGQLGGVALKDILTLVQIGGERKGGFGLIKDIYLNSAHHLFGYEIDLESDRPTLKVPSQTEMPFYLKWEAGLRIKGCPFPLVKRRHLPHLGSGLRLEGPHILYDLGWSAPTDCLITIGPEYCEYLK